MRRCGALCLRLVDKSNTIASGRVGGFRTRAEAVSLQRMRRTAHRKRERTTYCKVILPAFTSSTDFLPLHVFVKVEARTWRKSRWGRRQGMCFAVNLFSSALGTWDRKSSAALSRACRTKAIAGEREWASAGGNSLQLRGRGVAPPLCLCMTPEACSTNKVQQVSC